MVGTAVYHVGRASFMLLKKFSALNPVEHQIDAPADSEAATAASSPWMWNNGITFMQRSSDTSVSESAICCAEAVTLDCSNGTILGRDVVPEVCRISATSSGPGSPSSAGAVSPSGS